LRKARALRQLWGGLQGRHDEDWAIKVNEKAEKPPRSESKKKKKEAFPDPSDPPERDFLNTINGEAYVFPEKKPERGGYDQKKKQPRSRTKPDFSLKCNTYDECHGK